MKKKILVFSGSRADYGLLKKVIIKLRLKKNIKLITVIGGQHISPLFGNTYREIINDKIKINYICPHKIKSTEEKEIINNISKSLVYFNAVLKKSKPDLILLLGDRYEVYSFALSAFLMGFYIAHIHGGEITQGAFDDSLRHSITKFSNLHFVSHKKYKKRIIQLGENPKNIYIVGSLGCENARTVKFKSKKQLFSSYNIPLKKKKILITHHPETKSKLNYNDQIKNILIAIKMLKNTHFIITYPNSDTKGKKFIREIENFKRKNPRNTTLIKSMGAKLYLNFLKHVDLILGNSSSGIIESPTLKTPTVNIGERQSGREFSKSIFTCGNEKLQIYKTIQKTINSKNKIIFDDIYYKNNTSKQIVKIITKLIYKKNFEKNYNKKFYDIKI